MSDLCLKITGLKLVPLYKTMKVSNYFHLKSMTPLGLCSNVVYCYTCPCDTGLTYLGMSSRHLVTRAKEHVDLNHLERVQLKTTFWTALNVSIHRTVWPRSKFFKTAKMSMTRKFIKHSFQTEIKPPALCQ